MRTLGLTLEEFFSGDFKTDMGETKWERYRAAAEGYVILISSICTQLLTDIFLSNYLSTYSHFERDPEASRKIVPEQWNFGQWARQSKELAVLFEEDRDRREEKEQHGRQNDKEK